MQRFPSGSFTHLPLLPKPNFNTQMTIASFPLRGIELLCAPDNAPNVNFRSTFPTRAFSLADFSGNKKFRSAIAALDKTGVIREIGIDQIENGEYTIYAFTDLGGALARAVRKSSAINTGQHRTFRMFDLLEGLPPHIHKWLSSLPNRGSAVPEYAGLFNELQLTKVRWRTQQCDLDRLSYPTLAEFYQFHPELITPPDELMIPSTTRTDDRDLLEGLHRSMTETYHDHKLAEIIADDDEWDIL